MAKPEIRAAERPVINSPASKIPIGTFVSMREIGTNMMIHE